MAGMGKRFVAWGVTAAFIAGSAVVGLLAPPWTTSGTAPLRSTLTQGCPAASEASANHRLTATADDPQLAVAPIDDPVSLAPPPDPVWTMPTTASRVALSSTGSATATAAVWASDGPERGLSAITCGGARTDTWYVGVRSDDQHQASVDVINLDATEAEVALTFYGPDGRVASAGSRGLSVPAHGSRTIPLGPLLSSDQPVSVRVEATAGRVVSYIRVIRWDGTTPLGAEWVPESAPPAETAVVPGVPAGKGNRTLVITNPTERVVQASVEILSDGGAFEPVGAEGLDLPPQSTRTLDLKPGLSGQPGSIRLSATGEVLAGIEASRGGNAAKDDVTVLASTVPLGGEGATVWAGPAVRKALVLANAESAEATAQVVMSAQDGTSVSTEEVVVPAYSSVELASPEDRVVTWSVTSASLSLRGVVIAHGSVGSAGGLTSLALTGARTESDAPRLIPDPFVGV